MSTQNVFTTAASWHASLESVLLMVRATGKTAHAKPGRISEPVECVAVLDGSCPDMLQRTVVVYDDLLPILGPIQAKAAASASTSALIASRPAA